MSDNKREAEAVVSRSMPGWRVVSERPTSDTPRQADVALPSMATLRTKYLGAPSPRPSDSSGDGTVTQVVTVESDVSSDGEVRKLRERVGVRGGKVRWKTG
ncbi:hypothetical protein [Deinococcus humi]|uniref:Uncharacterized protein n=1 Tax=Deinococcus humi TaxID=662880 RepID=A0A7W8K1F6_9DEIO|nr:hypothetical protein [Deinococcus humi]MBB5365726.1 hypothetical protein [Deinococcus humi]GGO38435.1 hypothetical protein GCM10008949_44970 [Deinococcus humi]